MLDLETLGRRPGCVILSIGAILFDRSGIDEDHVFYTNIDIDSSLAYGLQVEGATIEWWMSQSDEARNRVLFNPVNIGTALNKFLEWKAAYSCLENTKIWGNGSDFDISILQEAFMRVHVRWPFKFWNHRCYRTLKSEVNDKEKNLMKTVPRTGEHQADMDAMYQARIALIILTERDKI
jgi:hypothetical protein